MGKWGECPLFQGQISTHTPVYTLSQCMHTRAHTQSQCVHTRVHTQHTHIPMHARALTHAHVGVQGTSGEVTLPQG